MNIRKRLFRSLSSTINAFYGVVILLFMLLTGSILYSVANNQVTQNTTETMDSVLNQKIEYLSFIYKDAFEQFYALTHDGSVQQLVNSPIPSSQIYLELSEEVNYVYRRNAALIDSIYVKINDYDTITASEQQSLNKFFRPYNLFPAQSRVREGYHWRNNHIDPIFNRNQQVQSIVYTIEDSNGEIAGTFVMNLKTAFIERNLIDLAMEGSYMMLLSEDGYYVSLEAPANRDLSREIYERYLAGDTPEKNEEIQVADSETYLIRHETIGANKWELVLVTPIQSLINFDKWLLLIVVIATVLLAIFAILILQMIRRYISNPIQKLSQSMLTTESYHEKLESPDDVPQELTVLYDSYNYLTDRNVHLIEQMTAQQQEKMELEVALLHAQISPHFLYNTLFSIKGLVDMKMNKEASEMVSKLSDFFRTSLSRGKEIITLKEELKNIESYLYMMEMRYGDFFQYQIIVSEDLYDNLIVKLSLQPLVENAIYHGVMGDRGEGLITIGSELLDDDIIIYVEDNGGGIATDKLERIRAEIKAPYLSGSREDTGVGLRSVDIRLKNRYGEQYGLSITSQVGEYTKVSVRIPKLKGNDYLV